MSVSSQGHRRRARVTIDDAGEVVFETTARGYEVLRDPALNKGAAFDAAERVALDLEGLLPPGPPVELVDQVRREYGVYSSYESDLQRHVFMWQLHDENVTLFYALLQAHLVEMLPVVYDPTVADAIEQYSEIHARPRGLFLSIDEIDRLPAMLAAVGAAGDEIDLVVTTDAEEILGIGDWGSNGIDICVGKLAVYTAAAGVDPARVLPVVLDVGTDNPQLLDDPFYVGTRHGRVRGDAYFEFVDAYVAAVRVAFPNALLHWEDFGSTTCREILSRHPDVPAFNDDMQGTGAIALAGLLNAVDVAGTSWSDQRVVIFGAGTAGCGIADQVRDQLVREGLTAAEAAGRIHLVDLPGLLTEDMDGLLPYQRPYAKPADAVAGWTRTPALSDPPGTSRWPAMERLRTQRTAGLIDLATTVEQVRPTILIGTSTCPGAFTETIVTGLAAEVERPVIFPLSNPTQLAEATPADLLSWTDGRVIVCTGSPFDDVTVDGITHRIGQANNAALYPGLGLGAIVCSAARVSDGMIHAAANAVAGRADCSEPGAAMLPPNSVLQSTSRAVAVAVVRAAIEEGLATVEVEEPVEAVRAAQWSPVYRRVVAAPS